MNNDELITMINKYGLIDCVHLLGIIHNMPLFMSSIDLLVNNSYGESFSLVLAEALSCETLCVSTNEGDPESIIQGIGMHVPAGNTPLLSKAIINMIKSDSLEENKTKGREKIISSYSMEIVMKKYKLLYSYN